MVMATNQGMFTNQSSTPSSGFVYVVGNRTFNTAEEAKQYLARNPGAGTISRVPFQNVTGPTTSGPFNVPTTPTGQQRGGGMMQNITTTAPTKQAPIIVGAPAPTSTTKRTAGDTGPIIANPGGMLPIPPATTKTPEPTKQAPIIVGTPDPVKTTKGIYESPPIIPQPGQIPLPGPGETVEEDETRATEQFDEMGEEEPEEITTFTFVEGRERGGQAQNYLYGQTGEVQQVTVDELRDYFESDKVNRLPEVFGTFENYLAYMTEREQLIRSGDYDIGNWSEADAGFTPEQEMLLAGEDLFIDPSDPMQDPVQLERIQRQTQVAAYENWINSEANQALLQKYGVSPVVYSKSGDKFAWNGSAYVKTVDEKHAGVGDFIKIGVAIAAGIASGGALSGALSSALGATGSAAVGAGLGSVISQGIATGKIDLEKALIAAATAGISNEFAEFMDDYVQGSTQARIQELRDIQARVQQGGAAYQAAQQQIELLTGVLEASDLVNQGESIMNLVGNASQAYNQFRDIQENINDFVNQNEDAAWQTPDTTGVLGDVQVQIRDYISELEEQREESGQTGQNGAQPTEDIFADTTEEGSIIEDLFNDYMEEFRAEFEGQQNITIEQVQEVVASALGGIEQPEALTQEQIQQIVNDAISSIPQADTLSEEQVQEIVGNAVNAIEIPEGITTEEVSSIVNEAIAGIPAGTSPEQVQEIVNQAISGIEIPEGMTPEQVQTIVDTAVSNIQFPEGISAEDVQGIVNQAIASIEFPEIDTLSTNEVQSIVDAAIGGIQFPEGVTADQVLEIIQAQLAAQPEGLSSNDVNEIVSSAISSIQFPESVTQEEVNSLVNQVQENVETSLAQVGERVTDVERSLQDALQSAQAGQARALSEAEARLLSEITGVNAQTLQQLSAVEGGLQRQLEQMGSDLNSVRNELGTSIFGVQREVSDVERSLTLALEAASLGQTTALNDAEARLLSQLTGIEADILQEMATSEAGLQQQLSDVGTNINQVRVDLQSQIQTTQEQTAESLEQASNERRDLQQALISVQGNVNQLDESTRQQFEEFGGTVNELFSDVNVDIEGLRQGQVSQQEAQSDFEESVASQFGGITEQLGELGSQVSGLMSDVTGIGEGLEGLGQGLGEGLLGLAAAQPTAQQIASAMPRQPVKFDPFLKGLSPFQPLTPLSLSPVQEKDALSELNKFIGRQSGMLV